MNPSGCGDFGNVFPLQVNQIAPEGVQVYQLIWTLGICAIVIAYAAYRWARFKDTVLMALMGAGFLAFFNELNLEFLVHVTQSANARWPVYTTYGMPAPLFELTGYVAVFPLFAYIIYRNLIKGMNMKGVWTIFILIAFSDVLMEAGVVSGAHPLYRYQPVQVLRILDFPLYNTWINSVAWTMSGVLVYWFEGLFKGLKRPLLSLLPAFAMCIGWGILDVPIVCALNIRNMPVYGQYLLNILSLVLALFMTYLMAIFVGMDSPARLLMPWPLTKKEKEQRAGKAEPVLAR